MGYFQQSNRVVAEQDVLVVQGVPADKVQPVVERFAKADGRDVTELMKAGQFEFASTGGSLFFARKGGAFEVEIEVKRGAKFDGGVAAFRTLAGTRPTVVIEGSKASVFGAKKVARPKRATPRKVARS